MTREELLTLPLHELDAMVAEKVFGFVNAVKVLKGRYGATIEGYVDHWSSDDNAVRLVRDRIAELNCGDRYVRMLHEILWPGCRHTAEQGFSIAGVFRVQNATPKQQCIAALLAVEEGPGSK